MFLAARYLLFLPGFRVENLKDDSKKRLQINPAKRNVLVVKNETRILEQKRKVIQKFQ